MRRIRVLLADDHAATAQLWRELIEPEFQVVGMVDGGAALVDASERLQPDAIVTDVTMPGMSGIAAAEIILRRSPTARIVFATVHADEAMLRKCLAVGGFGYVLKVRVGEDLAPAIRAALRGELLISPFPAWRERAIEGSDDVDPAARSSHQQDAETRR
jgi:DNA-binding NarL/FixJ family response regulator